MSRRFMLAALLALTPALAARAATLGVANDYNVFVLGDLIKTNVDASGKVAVGGNATLENYSVGSAYGASSTNLIVNGNLDKPNWGGTFAGNVLVNGNANISNPTITGQLQVNGNVAMSNNGTVTGGIVHNGSYTSSSTFANSTGYTALPFSFADAGTYLTSSSTFWGALATTGTVANPYNNLSLTGTSSTLNVFNVAAAMIGSATVVNINAPANSTVLVNFIGTSVSASNFGINFSGGIDKQHVLYNFPTATSVNIANIGVLGSILAPLATVNFTSGNIDGTLIANKLTGTGEEHNFLFTGTLPDQPIAGPTINPPTVPTPAAAAGGLSLLALLAFRKLRRSDR